jgi:hypothetical protein
VVAREAGLPKPFRGSAKLLQVEEGSMRQNRYNEDAATEPYPARVDGASETAYSREKHLMQIRVHKVGGGTRKCY